MLYSCMSHRDLFDCEYPIVCLPMNRTSDLKLAIAVAKNGCLPSLVMSSYSHGWGKTFFYERFCSDLVKFVKELGHCRIMLSMTDFFLINHTDKLLKIAEMFGVKHIELTPYYGGGQEHDNFSIEAYIESIMKLRAKGVKFIIKCLFVPVEDIAKSLIKHNIVDAIIVKSNRGAGKAHWGHITLAKLVAKAKFLYPNIHIIACGGIANSNDIQECLDVGATAVGLGTVFAMSKECRISEKSKALVLASKKIVPIETVGLPQNGIVFEKHEGWDNDNNSLALEKGVEGTGGHLMIGHAIHQINEILSIEEIVKKLVPVDGFKQMAPVVGVEPTPSVLETDVLP